MFSVVAIDNNMFLGDRSLEKESDEMISRCCGKRVDGRLYHKKATKVKWEVNTHLFVVLETAIMEPHHSPKSIIFSVEKAQVTEGILREPVTSLWHLWNAEDDTTLHVKYRATMGSESTSQVIWEQDVQELQDAG